jgi:aspartate aminotransferase-like enzyme
MFTSNKWPYRLLTPGPVPLLPEVSALLSEPVIHHRTPEFEKTLKNVLTGLKEIFATKQDVFIHTATGSGAMESAIVNTLSPGDEVLCIVSGKFGERWAQMCEVYGLIVDRINVPWGEAVNVTEVEKKIKAETKAVLTQACETSTATIHPIKDLATIIKSLPNTIFMVDGITAVGAMELEMDDWGIDVLIGGSQKAFMCPTGLAFIALSDKAWKFAEKSKLPKYYFDLKLEKESLKKGETHFSSNVLLIQALEKILPNLAGPGRTKTRQRIERLALATREASQHLKMKVFSKAPSPSVTAILVPEGIDSQKLRGHLEKEFNITVMGGQDQLKGKILRIGHLGYILNEDMIAFFTALYTSLKTMGVDLNEKNLESAIETYKKRIII